MRRILRVWGAAVLVCLAMMGVWSFAMTARTGQRDHAFHNILDVATAFTSVFALATLVGLRPFVHESRSTSSTSPRNHTGTGRRDVTRRRYISCCWNGLPGIRKPANHSRLGSIRGRPPLELLRISDTVHGRRSLLRILMESNATGARAAPAMMNCPGETFVLSCLSASWPSWPKTS
jgi:hypothetical protein